MSKIILPLFLTCAIWTATTTISYAQIPSGFDPKVETRADNGNNLQSIRNPVLFGDNLGRYQLAGWITSQKYHVSAEIRATVTGLPTSTSLPADLIFSTGGSTLKNRFRIGENGLASFNSDDLPAQLSVTQYIDQNSGNSNLFMVRGGTSAAVKSFRLYAEGNDQLTASMQGNFHILNDANLSIFSSSAPDPLNLRVRITANGNSFFNGGNVGIGEANPQERLAVQGNALVDGNVSVKKQLFIGTNYVPGSTVTDYKIFADGGILCTKVNILYRNNWPDYVFDKNYILMPLSDLGNYIARHGRLPDIPSATEVQDNGIDVGEMQKKLLEKLEELTLYILDQQKAIEGLKKEITTLKTARN